MSKLAVEQLFKIFGDRSQEALALYRRGESRARINESLGCVVALADASFQVEEGSIFMIMGLSGSGKSTLVRCLNRLIEPTSGRIALDGEDVTAAGPDRLREIRRSKISMVFQHFALLPHKTVLENAAFGLKIRGNDPVQRRRKAEEVLEIVGLAAWRDHYPDSLSGGMRQRVGLARALATEAEILVMDEAFSALDPLIRAEMQEELLRLQRLLRRTIVFITHDIQEALRLGHRIAVMSEGRIVQQDAPLDIVAKPANDYVAAFVRETDRARVFDARFAMEAAAAIRIGEIDAGAAVARMDEGDEPALFVVDGEHRLLGLLTRQAAADLAARGARVDKAVLSMLEHAVGTVGPEEKLVDAAARCRGNRPIAVIDEAGVFLGSLAPHRIVSFLAAPASDPSARNTEAGYRSG